MDDNFVCRHPVVAALAGLCVLYAADAAYGQEFVVTIIGPIDLESEARAVNDIGDVVGVVEDDMSGQDRPFAWRNGEYFPLPTPRAMAGEAHGVNVDLEVVGAVLDRAGRWQFKLEGFEFSHILDPPSSHAEDINDLGHIVGFRAAGGAFVWLDGEVGDLGPMTAARAINNAGDIAGDTRTPPQDDTHAGLYSQGSVLDLGTLGGTISRAYDVNAFGDVVGWSQLPEPGVGHAFLYAAGEMLDLGTLGGQDSTARAINDAGWIVGKSHKPPGGGGDRAVLWRDGEILDLNDLVPPDTPRTMFEAIDVNNAGQIIVSMPPGIGSATRTAALLTPAELDCNANGVLDDMDLIYGNSADCNANGILDVCEQDCNGNGVHDDCDVAEGTSPDCNANGFPDECELAQARVPLAQLHPVSGLAIHGALPDEASGYSVAGAGDVNGDGVSDLVIGSGAQPRCPDREVELHGGNSYVVFGRQDLATGDVMDLAGLDGVTGFVVVREDSTAGAVARVGPAGDVNGDGFDDVLIGAPLFDGPGVGLSGRCYLVFGGPDVGADGPLELAALDGSDGVTFPATMPSEQLGAAVDSAGDVDGDGWDDLLIGGEGNVAYLVFGGPPPWPAEVELDELASSAASGQRGVRLVLPSIFGLLGFSVSSAGDFNADGVDDFAVSAPDEGSGVVYVVFGHTGPWPEVLAVQTAAPTERMRIIGHQANGYTGYSVSGGSDVNADGIDDLIVGAPLVPNDAGNTFVSGETYVIFGSSEPPPVLFPSSLDGTNGFVAPGQEAFQTTGSVVAALSDFNADGVGDFMLAEAGISLAVAGSGDLLSIGDEIFVLFGAADIGASGVQDFGAADGTSVVVVQGVREFDQTGRSIAGAGDVNDDGIEDIVIGAPGAGGSCTTPARGVTFVLFGRPPDRDGGGVPDECEVVIVSSDPPDGAIDARVPRHSFGKGPLGWDAVEVTLDRPIVGVTAADFEVLSTAGPGPKPTGVRRSGKSIEVLLEEPIPAGHCTTVRHVPSDSVVRLGFLPADANEDGTSGQLDILALIDDLNGLSDPPLAPWQCDINRSGSCEPADILTLVDLLNGAGLQDAWLGVPLPACP